MECADISQEECAKIDSCHWRENVFNARTYEYTDECVPIYAFKDDASKGGGSLSSLWVLIWVFIALILLYLIMRFYVANNEVGRGM